MDTTENWKPVVGYEGYYEVSDQGRVRSVDRMIPQVRYPGDRLMRGRVLRPGRSIGYLHVNLSVGGENWIAKIQWLVAAAFIGPRPEGALVCHNNGDRTDNRLENLRYGTYSDNNLDTVAHGNHWQASKTHCKHGHEYTAENTIIRHSEGGNRRCRTCDSERGKRRWQEELAHRSA